MSWYQSLDPIAPLTVIVAISIFVLKELIESLRRYKARARKADLIRSLIIEELELNKWTITSLKRILEEIKSSIDGDPGSQFLLKRDASGGIHFRRIRSDGGVGGSAIPDVNRKNFDRFIIDLAEVDKNLFDKVRMGYAQIGDLAHIRNSLVAYLSEEESDKQFLLRGFPSYGLETLASIESKMATLYVFCSGKPFETARLR